ncbi:MAG: HepT-like ribonuclease domain-containing protein [Thermoplasmata archaeon]
MRGRRTDARVLLDDMAQYASTIARWVAKGHGAFLDPETGSQATIERQFEMFEEAADALGSAFQKANPRVPWADIYEIRNEFSHPYKESYDREKLWRFVRDRFPRIARRLRRPVLPNGPDPAAEVHRE